jgi:hypothetical protein
MYEATQNNLQPKSIGVKLNTHNFFEQGGSDPIL